MSIGSWRVSRKAQRFRLPVPAPRRAGGGRADRGGLMPGVRWGMARWGVRVRSAFASALVVAVAFGVAALALLWVLQHSLQSAADTAATARTQQIAQRLLADSPAELDRALLATDARTTIVQVIDGGGQVLLSSPGAPTTPVSTVRPGPGDVLSLGTVDNTADGGNYRITAQGVSGPNGTFTVLIGAGQDPIDATLVTVAALLALGLPVLVLVAGAATFTLVGRSLRPVEHMRTRVATITSADLSERVPVPTARDEIFRLAQTMNAMLGRIETAHTAQRRFVGDASHELRSPLATVTAALELARDRPQVWDHTLLQETLLPEVERMRALVEDLLLLATADERGVALRIGDVDLDDIIGGEAARLRSLDSFTVRVNVHPVQVRGDATRLARAVRNLADNAARHARSTITLSCAAEHGHAVIAVADDGRGIPAPDRDRVFERFVRLDTGRARAAGGSGLGLAIVTEIVTAHGGTVTVTDAAEGGAKFVLRLPLHGPTQRQPTGAASPVIRVTRSP